jgi:hypothetical protein
VAAISPPRLRAPLDVLFLVGVGTLVAHLVERRRLRSQPVGDDYGSDAPTSATDAAVAVPAVRKST